LSAKVAFVPKEEEMNNSMMKIVWTTLAFIATCETAVSSTTSYQYDALGRLSVVTEGAATVNYSYDPAGNRTQKQTSGGTVTAITMPSSTAQEHRGSVVLRVNVGGSSPGGTVSFYEGSAFLGSAPISGGLATVELIGLSRGSHTITARYSGDVTNAANSVSFPVKVVNLDWLPAVLDILMN
jgi:YD repeat-containing protein